MSNIDELKLSHQKQQAKRGSKTLLRAYRVTYTNGDSYITSANGTLEEFTTYITQSYHVEEDQVTGKETKLYVATVEEVTEEQ